MCLATCDACNDAWKGPYKLFEEEGPDIGLENKVLPLASTFNMLQRVIPNPI